MHLDDAEGIAGHAADAPAALVAFDLLLDGDETLLDEPWTARRRARARVRAPRGRRGAAVRRDGVGDGDAMLARARASGWEGVDREAHRRAVRAGPPRAALAEAQDRAPPGARRRRLDRAAQLAPAPRRAAARLLRRGRAPSCTRGTRAAASRGRGCATWRAARAARAPQTSPFADAPRTNESAHWVEPRVVVEVKFVEWTDDGRLRQPIYLGTRDDKAARSVTREAGERAEGCAERARSCLTARRMAGRARRRRRIAGGDAALFRSGV